MDTDDAVPTAASASPSPTSSADEDLGHVFDQTNGLAGDIDGDEDRAPEDRVDPDGEVLLDPIFSDEERRDRIEDDGAI